MAMQAGSPICRHQPRLRRRRRGSGCVCSTSNALSVTSLEPHRSRTSKLDSRSRMLLTPGSFHPLQAYKRRVCNLVQFSAMACSEASVSSAQRVRSSDVSAGHFCATCRHPSSVKCLHPDSRRLTRLVFAPTIALMPVSVILTFQYRLSAVRLVHPFAREISPSSVYCWHAFKFKLLSITHDDINSKVPSSTPPPYSRFRSVHVFSEPFSLSARTCSPASFASCRFNAKPFSSPLAAIAGR
mmetsp:Transcript_34379/g.81985  ORF Transcript_34379/g.81985 Transcript_34379/m.81985 type:complete len:241 (+) Transcript_34379:639-1361(+)